MITEQYKEIAVNQFKRMHINYPGAFFRGGFNDMAPAIAVWIKALIAANVKEVEIQDFVDFIINDYPQTKNIPPQHSELSIIYSSFKEKSSKLDVKEVADEIDQAIYNAYRYLSFKYDRLFKGDSFTREEHFELWSADLKTSGATPEGINKAIEKIKRSVDFIQYPPNISQFSLIALVSSMEGGDSHAS